MDAITVTASFTSAESVSIHAPVMDAMLNIIRSVLLDLVSIHAPVMDAMPTYSLESVL